MLKSEQEGLDLQKLLLHSMEVNGLSGVGSSDTVSPAFDALPHSSSAPIDLSSLLGGLVNQHALLSAQRMDAPHTMSTMMEQLQALQQHIFMPSLPTPTVLAQPTVDEEAMEGGSRDDYEGGDTVVRMEHDGASPSSPTHSPFKTESNENRSPRVSFPCSECESVFDSAALLAQHSVLTHNTIPNLFPALIADGTLPSFLLQSPLHNAFSALNNTTPSAAKSAAPKRSYSSAGKNYCDVCNKEVCNKYFLRTHMLKMHGIVIDENKPVIANIDTREKERAGELSFRCDMCSTELKSRQQLREHKSSVHGVAYPVGTPANSSPVKQLPLTPTNMIVPSTPLLFPQQFTCESSLSLPAASQVPPLGEFPSVESSVSPPTTSSHSTTTTATNTDTRLMEPSVASVKCEHCHYTTRYQRNMEYHVERHERLNEELNCPTEEEGEEKEKGGDKLFDQFALRVVLQQQGEALRMERTRCSKCRRNFSTPQRYALHEKTFHALAGLDACKAQLAKQRKLHVGMRMHKEWRKKWGRPERETIERHSHTSGSVSPLRAELHTVESSQVIFGRQHFDVFCNSTSAPFPPAFSLSLPVSSPLLHPLTVSFTLNPLSPS